MAILAIVIAGICALPYAAVVVAAFSAGSDTLAHLADTVLWRYFTTTLILVICVGVGARSNE